MVFHIEDLERASFKKNADGDTYTVTQNFEDGSQIVFPRATVEIKLDALVDISGDYLKFNMAENKPNKIEVLLTKIKEFFGGKSNG